MLSSSFPLPLPLPLFLSFPFLFSFSSHSAFTWLGFFHFSFDIGVLLVVYCFLRKITYLCLIWQEAGLFIVLFSPLLSALASLTGLFSPYSFFPLVSAFPSFCSSLGEGASGFLNLIFLVLWGLWVLYLSSSSL